MQNDKLPTFNLYLCDSDDGGAGAGGVGGTGRTTAGGSGDGASSQAAELAQDLRRKRVLAAMPAILWSESVEDRPWL